jgi:two-component system cell cycle sensor histidine kinase/response regulator CckA
MLLGGGYVVIEAASGTEALRLCRAHHGRIDLLLTDVVMHGMDGPTLAESFTRLRADASVLFISGHTADALNADWIATRPVRFLAKPFSSDQLTHHVRAVLAGSQTAQ